jgi:SAM-dependent methyltransferase
MKAMDRLLQRWRMWKACHYVSTGSRVIDIGAHQGELFYYLGSKLEVGFGIDPLVKSRVDVGKFSIVPGYFPTVCPSETEWDVITMLAVLEHVPRSGHIELVDGCFDLLKRGGLIIITVPSPLVDRILDVLKSLRLIDGMSLEEHFGFLPNEVLPMFSGRGFKLVLHKKFQLGLNHIFVIQKTARDG